MKNHNILDIIKKMNEINEDKIILKYENILARMIYSPILLIGSLSNFVVIYLIWHKNLKDVLINSLFLLAFSLCFEIFSRITKNERLKSYIFSALFSAVLVFMVIRFYYLIGATVWTISTIVIIISMMRIKRSMLLAITLTTFILNMYVWYKSLLFFIGPIYYIAQTVSFAILFIVIASVHEIIINRFKKIHEQFGYIINSKNELLNSSENTFKIIFEGSSDGILIIKNHEFIDCNPAAVEMLRCDSKESIIGKSVWDISPYLQPDGKISKEKVFEIIQTFQNTRKLKFEWWYKKSNGVILPVEIMLTEIIIRREKMFHALCRDISERKQMENKLEYISYHDPLTGLYNRRFYEEELKRLDTVTNLPLTIVMGDINGLKFINDSLGHIMGDELIKKVAKIITKGCRDEDIIVRLGGDEFIVLLSKTNSRETEQIIKRIINLSSSEKVGSVDISISLGYGTKNNEEEDIQVIFKNAEDHMYKIKLLEGPSIRGKTIKAMINTLYEKNKSQEQHSRRVSALCKSIGEALQLPNYEIEELRSVGLLHDIGKIAIDESILNKPGKLTDEEWVQMKRHTEIGYRILLKANDLPDMANYVLYHHERWDGKGYPKGLKDHEIPFVSRIIAIADSYDAMTSERSYRSALPEDVVLDELRKNAGIQFDPELVNVFIEKLLGQMSKL